VRWILRYLRGTKDIGLVFHKNHNTCSNIVGYVNSNYAGDLDKRRSQIRYVFMLFGSAISWKTTLQSTIALSTTEAEYMAAAEAVKEAIWLRSLVDNLGLKQDITIHLSKNQMYHERTKHIDVRYHFLREIISHDKFYCEKDWYF